MSKWLKLIVLFLSFGRPSFAGATDACPGADHAVTVPAPVDVPSIQGSLEKLKLLNKKPAMNLTEEVNISLRSIFNPEITKTKMEQFYRLLYLINNHLHAKENESVELEAAPVRDVLMKSAVFTAPDIPNRIVGVKIDRHHEERPRYEVRFSDPSSEVILNNGEGFYTFQNGKCQHAMKLIFQETFSVTLSINRKGNIEADDFRGVDLFGDFGNRGIFSIDLQYVELRSVEFYRGTSSGKITAYVSRQEFKKNEHNSLLRLITKFVADKSVQPIDW